MQQSPPQARHDTEQRAQRDGCDCPPWVDECMHFGDLVLIRHGFYACLIRQPVMQDDGDHAPAIWGEIPYESHEAALQAFETEGRERLMREAE